MIKKLLLGLVVLVVLVALFASGNNETATTNTSTEQTMEEIQETATPVTAREIFSAYESNEVAADQKYKGKLLEVTGKVSGIDSGFSDNAIINLATSNDFMDVQATGNDEFTTKAATLNKGQEIKMICTGDGEVAGFPMLDDCVIQ